MACLVTGGTGFIGQYLVARLLLRGGPVYVLVRPGSMGKLDALKEKWGSASAQVIPLEGDINQPDLGLTDADLKMLNGKVTHFFHLAAIYDLAASAEEQRVTNVKGTRNAVQLAQRLEAGCFHLMSSVAAAGLYEGVFREDMFDEAEGLKHPYFETKHESEKVVRKECKRPFRIYRPSFVVGDSKTGFMEKVDGPYYFFKLLQRLRQTLPPWVPMAGIEGGRVNIVPVDFVAAAMDHLAHAPGLDGKCFHLTDPESHRVGEVLNIFAKAGHAPQMTMRINTRMFGFIPPAVLLGLKSLTPVQRLVRAVLTDLGIPRDVFQFINWPTRYDNREATQGLAGSGISVPPLKSYAPTLWDYWERHLDPDLFIDRSLAGKVKDKVVVVTGASSGIGRAAALKLAEAGAKVMLVARGEKELQETRAEIERVKGNAWVYPTDLTDMTACDVLVKRVLAEHGRCDFLINNAGRSIRRGVDNSYNRFHDYERTMQLNYFGALRLTLGFLPSMTQQKSGHVINVSSIGVLSHVPRFSAYVASKSALDAFAACAASEFLHKGIHFTTINMPLVKTPMIEPTRMYESIPTLTPEEAADLVVQAVVGRPVRIATRLGIFGAISHAAAPRVTQIVLNTAYNMFPDSPVGKDGAEKELTPEQMAFAALTQGIHW